MNRGVLSGLVAWLGLAFLVGAAACDSFAQDGKLVDASVVTLRDEDIKGLESRQPDIRAVLERIEIRSITYLSDGLKITGYLVAPKKGENLPCVIFNRGGNREFGALTDLRAAAVLGRIGARALKDTNGAALEVSVLDASKFRFVVRPVSLGYLMVVTEPLAAPDPVLGEMTNAAAFLDQASSTLAEPRVA